MSKNKKTSYFQTKHQADKTFGRSTFRPQDEDKQLAIQCRRTNLEIKCDMPKNYVEDLQSKMLQFKIPTTLQLPQKMTNVKWITGGVNTIEVWHEMTKAGVFGVDFEMHNEETFDGFLCVSSLSSGSETYVVDCLNLQRHYAKKLLTDLFTSEKCLKVMCGNANDLTRLRKDWQIFPHVVVDLQEMFLVYKRDQFEDCLTECREAIKDKLKSNGKPQTDAAVAEYLQNLPTPGLGFLAKAFLNHSSPKTELCTLADWRKRPLHKSLLNYAGSDAFLTLQVYDRLSQKIGINGIRDAMLIGIKKSLSVGKLSNYSNPSPPNPAQWTTFKRIIIWRDYLAKNLDKKPAHVISDSNVTALVGKIHMKHLSLDEMENLLKSFKVGDDPRKAGHLLKVYVEQDTKVLMSMRDIICRRCNEIGHTARFCYTDLTPAEQRDRRHSLWQRPEKQDEKKKKNKTNWEKYCERNNRDPSTIPWLKKT